MTRSFVVLMVLLSTLFSASAETWIDGKGRKLTADFVSGTSEAVVLKRKDGRQLTVPLKHLNKESRDQALQLIAEANAGGAEDFGKPVEEPNPTVAAVKTKVGKSRRGRRLGKSLKSFDLGGASLTIFDQGHGLIQFKEIGGKLVSNPIEVLPRVRYHDENRKKRNKSFVSHLTPPKVGANSVSFHMQHEKGAVVRVHYEVVKQKLTLWYSAHEEGGLSFPAYNSAMSFEMPELVKWETENDQFRGPQYPDGVQFDQLQRVLGNKYMHGTGEAAGKATKLDFAQKIEKEDSMRKQALITVDSDVYGAASIRFNGPSQMAEMYHNIYTGKSLMDGFRVVLSNLELNVGNRTSAITVEVPAKP